MSDRVFLDTNVLVYAYDLDEPDKRAIAQRVLRYSILEEAGMLSAQVLGEFYVAVTRRVATPMSPAEAQRVVGHLQKLPVVEIDGSLARRAMETSQRYQVAYWDGLIIAAAERGQCTRILSEDLSDGQVYHGVTVVDPFANREDAGEG